MLSDLPLDVLPLILKALNAKERVRLALVNSKWKAIVFSRWTSVVLRSDPYKIGAELAGLARCNGERVKSLTVLTAGPSWYHYHGQECCRSISNLQNLQALHVRNSLSGTDGIALDSHSLKMLSNLHNLRHMVVTFNAEESRNLYCFTFITLAEFAIFPKLESLDVLIGATDDSRGRNVASEVSLSPQFCGLPGLTKLAIGVTRARAPVKFAILSSVFLEVCGRLKSLKLGDIREQFIQPEMAVSAPHLTHLEVGGDCALSVTNFPFKDLNSLQTLVMKVSTNLDANWTEALVRLANLTSLELTCQELPSDGVSALTSVAGRLPDLQELSIKCLRYPDLPVEAIFDPLIHLQRLQSFTLASPKRIGEPVFPLARILTAPNTLSSLTSLSLDSPAIWTDFDGRQVPALKKLAIRLSGCFPSISSTTLRSLRVVFETRDLPVSTSVQQLNVYGRLPHLKYFSGIVNAMESSSVPLLINKSLKESPQLREIHLQCDVHCHDLDESIVEFRQAQCLRACSLTESRTCVIPWIWRGRVDAGQRLRVHHVGLGQKDAANAVRCSACTPWQQLLRSTPPKKRLSHALTQQVQGCKALAVKNVSITCDLRGRDCTRDYCEYKSCCIVLRGTLLAGSGSSSDCYY